MADWMDSEVDVPDQSLTNAQVFALLRMTEAMRDTTVCGTVATMKEIMDRDPSFAGQLWSELAEDEQTALWVAPKFGGIFTTEERKIIKGGFNANK